MSVGRRSGILVALAIAACALAGCGMSTTAQVQAKVKQFAHAVATHDASTLCAQVLAPNLLNHIKGGDIACRRAMQIFLSTVHDPTLAVGRVVVNGNRAEALTLSGARHQIGALSGVELVNTSNGWRVSGLASSLLPGRSSKHHT